MPTPGQIGFGDTERRQELTAPTCPKKQGNTAQKQPEARAVGPNEASFFSRRSSSENFYPSFTAPRVPLQLFPDKGFFLSHGNVSNAEIANSRINNKACRDVWKG